MAAVASPEGLRATVSGGVPLDDGEMALDVALEGVSARRSQCRRAGPGPWRRVCPARPR